MNDVWELHTSLGSESWIICCTEEIGRQALLDWRNAVADVTGNGKFVVVEGFSNEASRPAKTHVYLVEEIKAMSLYPLHS